MTPLATGETLTSITTQSWLQTRNNQDNLNITISELDNQPADSRASQACLTSDQLLGESKDLGAEKELNIELN